MGTQEMNAFAALLNGFTQGRQMAKENQMKEASATSEEESKAVMNQYYRALVDKANRGDGYISPDVMTLAASNAGLPHQFDAPVSLSEANTYKSLFNDSMDYKERIRAHQEKSHTDAKLESAYGKRINELDKLRLSALTKLQTARQKLLDLQGKDHSIMSDRELAWTAEQIDKEKDNLNGFRAAVTIYDNEKKQAVANAWSQGIKVYGDPAIEVMGNNVGSDGMFDPTANPFSSQVRNVPTGVSEVAAPVFPGIETQGSDVINPNQDIPVQSKQFGISNLLGMFKNRPDAQ